MHRRMCPWCVCVSMRVCMHACACGRGPGMPVRACPGRRPMRLLVYVRACMRVMVWWCVCVAAVAAVAAPPLHAPHGAARRVAVSVCERTHRHSLLVPGSALLALAAELGYCSLALAAAAVLCSAPLCCAQAACCQIFACGCQSLNNSSPLPCPPSTVAPHEDSHRCEWSGVAGTAALPCPA